MKTRLEILAVEPEKEQVYVSGFGKEAVFREEQTGWRIIFKGFSIVVRHKPALKPGPVTLYLEQ